jgi:hypothetical protein
MSHRLVSFSLSSLSSVVAFGVGFFAVCWAPGCGQNNDVGQETNGTDQAADEALRAVRTCQAQAHDCVNDGGGAACEEQLRACLSSILPDAGPPTEHPEHDAARSNEPKAHDDAGHEGESDDDAEPSRGGPPDAGHAMPEAAVNALTKPVGHDGGGAMLGCVDDLRACLASDAKPSTCADDAQSCLKALHDGGKGN